MHIDFALADEQYIKNSVKNGYFRSASEAVRAAVRLAREQEETKQNRLLDALRLGDADIEAGRITQYTPQLLAEIEKEARQHAYEGGKPRPDVTP